MAATDFDEVGSGYGTQLARGLRLTGEPAEYYAGRRIARVRELVAALGVTPRAALDFGCGTGSSLGLLRDAFPDARVFGFEPEPELAKIAREAAATAQAELIDGEELTDTGIADVVYDGDPSDPLANRKLDFSRTLAFKDFRLELDPLVYRFSDIDVTNEAGIRGPNTWFTLFDFSAKNDPVPTIPARP